MGCASSTPMIQTTGSEMLKAATHVATDATKTAEDAVEGLKDSVGKTLETAKDSVAATAESVKHEVENVVKEKSEMLGDATNSLMEKLHLKQTENEGNHENSNKNVADIAKTETDELKTQLNEKLKNSSGESDALAEQTETVKGMKEHFVAATDTETDSLKTSTPEPEIEMALAKSRNAQEDDNDSPPTPKPTLAELENLTAEVLKQQHELPLVNDSTMSNDPLMTVMHENIKTLDSNSIKSSSADTDNNTIKDNEPTATITSNNNDDIKSAIVHKTPQTNRSPNPQVLQRPLPLATSAIATVAGTTRTAIGTAQSRTLKEKLKANKLSVQKKEEKIDAKCEEKRPGTTEWEKFADMLAQIRKFNPHDAYRRAGTLTKFGGNGVGQLRERSLLGHHMRNAMDDDNSDTTSTFRPSPQNSQRSSARPVEKINYITSRPNTGNSRTKPHEIAANNAGGNYVYKTRRSSNNSSATGRKFYYNPTRLRVNDFVSSSSFIESYLQNTVTSPLTSAPYSHSHESVKSLVNMRSHHSRSDMINLPPLEYQQRTRSQSQQEFTLPSHHHQQLRHVNDLSASVDYNGTSTPMQNVVYNHESPIITPQSSNTSLSSNSSHVEKSPAFKSSNLDVRAKTTTQAPVKNTSSFLTTPRCSPFGLTKSYTDLYFSTTCNKENKQMISSAKSPFRARKNLNVYSKKHSIK